MALGALSVHRERPAECVPAFLAALPPTCRPKGFAAFAVCSAASISPARLADQRESAGAAASRQQPLDPGNLALPSPSLQPNRGASCPLTLPPAPLTP